MSEIPEFVSPPVDQFETTETEQANVIESDEEIDNLSELERE